MWGTKYKDNFESWDKSQTEIHLDCKHLQFCKNILGVNRNTPYLDWRAELGRYFLLIGIQRKAAKVWYPLQNRTPEQYPLQNSTPEQYHLQNRTPEQYHTLLCS